MESQFEDGGGSYRIPVPILGEEGTCLFAILRGDGAAFVFRRDFVGENGGEFFLGNEGLFSVLLLKDLDVDGSFRLEGRVSKFVFRLFGILGFKGKIRLDGQDRV